MNLEDYRKREIKKSKYQKGDKVLVYHPGRKTVLTVLIKSVGAARVRSCVVGFDLYFFCQTSSGKRLSFVPEDNIKRGIKGG